MLHAALSVPDPAEPTLGGFVREVAERYGDRPAIVFEGETTTYAGLERRVREVAKGLTAAGVTKGTRVALLVANRPEWIAGVYATGAIGGIAIPISTFAGAEEREYVLRHCDAALLLVQDTLLKHHFVADLLARFPGIETGEPGRLAVPELPNLRRVVAVQTGAEAGPLETLDELVSRGRDVPDELIDALGADVTADDDAMVIYTSGTTAHPKGVLHAHRTPVLQSWRVGDHMRLTRDDRVLTSFPFFWTAGFTLGLGATLSAGATLILQESFDPARTLDLIESERVTVLFAAPHQDAALAEHPDAAARDLSSLRKLPANSPLRPLAGIDDDAWGLPGAYGLTETFTFATSVPSDAPLDRRLSSHGRPFPGIEVRIVDPLTEESLPPGELGEIAVRGLTFMKGYYKVPPEEVFDREGFFRTKDAGYLDPEGNLHWTGRLSGLIKTGGANVSPVEIEQELAAWGRLRTAMVVGVPHPTLGEAVVCCATLREEGAVGEDEVRGYLRGRVASYKVPKRVFFVDESEVTFTSSQQKVQLEALRRLAAERIVAEGLDAEWTAFLSEAVAPATAG